MLDKRRLRFLITLFALAVLFIACDRHIESTDPVRSLPDKPLTPRDLSILVNDQSLTLSWQLSDTTGINRYRVYRTTDPAISFAVTDSTSATSITLTGLSINQRYFFRVAAVTTSGIEGERSEIVSAVNGLLAIKISNDLKYTSKRAVQLDLITSGPTSFVTLSNDSLFADSLILTFSPQMGYVLPDGDGLKTIYARFTFNDGSASNASVSDDIILDTRATIRDVRFVPVSTSFVTGDTILFILDAGESQGTGSVSFGTGMQLTLRNDGTDGDAIAGDSLFSGSYVIPPNTTVLNANVVGSFTDEAGNIAPQYSSSQFLSISEALVPVQLQSATALSTFEIELIWVASTASSFESYRIYRASTAAVSKDSLLVSTINTRSAGNYTDTALNDGTTYYYVVYVQSNDGRDTLSNVVSAITDVNVNPIAVTLAGQLDSSGTSALLTWSQNSEKDFESYRVFRDTVIAVTNSSTPVGLISSSFTTTFTDFLPVGIDTAYYSVYVYDRHGGFTPSNVVQVIR